MEASDSKPEPPNPRKRGLPGRNRGGKKYKPIEIRPKTKLPKEDTECIRLTETDLGITEYVNDLKGFSGVIKQRYSDFLVNELQLDGTEVKLTNLNVPVEETNNEATNIDLDLNKILPEEKCNDISKLLTADAKNNPAVEINVTEVSKDKRKEIHGAIKKMYGYKLISTFVQRGDDKFISVTKYNKESPARRNSTTWPTKGDYVHFTIYKENMDTHEAVNLLSSKLRIKAQCVTYAGTKDRRAKTCQRACVRKIEPTKILSAARTLRNFSIGNFEYCKIPLQLGHLQGNRFKIVLRNVIGEDKDMKNNLESLIQNGFLNYYGLQRFGTQSVATHHIGRALLRGNWQEAVELILKPRGSGEHANLQETRKIWWNTRDAGKAFKNLRGKDKCIEGQLLLGLMKNHRNDLVNALENIPRNTRLMYLHAYQSYIWNLVLSRRIKEFGLNPIVGDLVLVEDSQLGDISLSTEDFEVVPETENVSSKSKLPNVKILKQEDLHNYTIKDIVLPLPGYEVTYPGNVIANWYEELMAIDELSTLALKHNIKKYTLSGTYRKIIVVPTEVKWQIMKYTDATKPLILSDLDQLQEKHLPINEPDGKYKALLLDFRLPSSAYATMALRELMKCDTSVKHQMSLNSYCLSSNCTEDPIHNKINNEEETVTPEVNTDLTGTE